MLRTTWKVQVCPKRMCSPGINGEGELRGKPANPGSPGKMAVKMECVCVTFHFCDFNFQA